VNHVLEKDRWSAGNHLARRHHHDTRRWVASRKARVVKAVAHGLMPLKEALDRYHLSEEEFGLWREAVARHGEKGLKVTAIQKYRQP
jgi:hypothetical protein